MTEIQDIEIDFKVYEGYVAFSSEVVRLALLSPTVFAFFVAVAGKDAAIKNLKDVIEPGRYQLMAGLAFMAMAVLFGLLHRYCAIDFMCTLVEERRRFKHRDKGWRLRASSAAIWAAPLCLLLGAASLFWSFFNVLGRA
jgi:hypothetical protein